MSLSRIVLITLLFLAGPLFAHNGAMGIVKERMDGMTELGKALKELTILSRTTPIDANAVKEQSDILVEHSGERLLDLFPVGSIQNVSEALPQIWDNWDRFEAYAMQLEREASNLPQISSPVVMQNALTLIQQNCTACHQRFRVEK